MLNIWHMVSERVDFLRFLLHAPRGLAETLTFSPGENCHTLKRASGRAEKTAKLLTENPSAAPSLPEADFGFGF